jgi:hypothetical protein
MRKMTCKTAQKTRVLVLGDVPPGPSVSVFNAVSACGGKLRKSSDSVQRHKKNFTASGGENYRHPIWSGVCRNRKNHVEEFVKAKKELVDKL